MPLSMQMMYEKCMKNGLNGWKMYIDWMEMNDCAIEYVIFRYCCGILYFYRQNDKNVWQ